MFKKDPLFGIGLDSYGDNYQLFRLPDQVEATGVQTVSNAAHSVVFHFLGTGGLALFGTCPVIQIVAVWFGIRVLHNAELRLHAGALLGLRTLFTLQTLFSINQFGLTVWGWVIAGLLTRLRPFSVFAVESQSL